MHIVVFEFKERLSILKVETGRNIPNFPNFSPIISIFYVWMDKLYLVPRYYMSMGCTDNPGFFYKGQILLVLRKDKTFDNRR